MFGGHCGSPFAGKWAVGRHGRGRHGGGFGWRGGMGGGDMVRAGRMLAQGDLQNSWRWR